jgi:hypothetical protein
MSFPRFGYAALTGLLALGTPGVVGLARAADDGLPCGRRLVTLGDPQAVVLDRCGEPASRTTRLETRFLRGRPYVVTVDDWTYRLGGRRFARRALFENGRLVSVEALSR